MSASVNDLIAALRRILRCVDDKGQLLDECIGSSWRYTWVPAIQEARELLGIGSPPLAPSLGEDPDFDVKEDSQVERDVARVMSENQRLSHLLHERDEIIAKKNAEIERWRQDHNAAEINLARCRDRMGKAVQELES